MVQLSAAQRAVTRAVAPETARLARARQPPGLMQIARPPGGQLALEVVGAEDQMRARGRVQGLAPAAEGDGATSGVDGT